MKDRRINRNEKYTIFSISKGHKALYGMRLLLLLYLLICCYYTIITILILLHLIYYVNLYLIFKSVYTLRLRNRSILFQLGNYFIILEMVYTKPCLKCLEHK